MKRRLAVLVLVLGLAGAWIAVDLTILHFRLEFGAAGGGACGPWGGCAEVVGGRYGQWRGMPLSLFGLWFYTSAIALALAIVLSPESAAARIRTLAGLATAALLVDLLLAWISWSRLGRFCPLCLLSYAVNIAIFACAAWLMRRERVSWRGAPELPGFAPLIRWVRHPRDRDALAAVIPAIAAAIILATLGTSLALTSEAREAERENRAGLLDYLRSTESVVLPEENRPSRGARGAPVTLIVFTDLLCNQCAVLDGYLDILAAGHGDSLRIVYRHFPMDSVCNPVRASRSPHPGACEMARAAECAARQGRYLEFVEAAHADGTPDPERIEDYATRAGLDLAAFHACFTDPSSFEAVARDVALGDSLEITATPTTFINGRAVVGPFKPWLWEEMIATVSKPRVRP
jgi:protein-disulfide isomerase/uncharacterized membrane protein